MKIGLIGAQEHAYSLCGFLHSAKGLDRLLLFEVATHIRLKRSAILQKPVSVFLSANYCLFSHAQALIGAQVHAYWLFGLFLHLERPFDRLLLFEVATHIRLKRSEFFKSQ